MELPPFVESYVKRPKSQCERCGQRLLFHERVVWPQQFCRQCSITLGIHRICDRPVKL